MDGIPRHGGSQTATWDTLGHTTAILAGDRERQRGRSGGPYGGRTAPVRGDSAGMAARVQVQVQRLEWYNRGFGEVAEWSIAPASKAGVP
jgi:hypothetical protein